MEDDKSALLVYIFLLVYRVQVLTIACVSVRLCVTLSVKYVHLFPFSPISPDQPMHSVLSAQISSCIQSVQPRSAPAFSPISPDQFLNSVLLAQISPCIQSCQPRSAPAFSPFSPDQPLHSVLLAQISS